MNIFKELKQMGVCFAVGIDETTFKTESVELWAKNCFLIGLNKDWEKLRQFGFSRLVENPRIMTLNLIDSEIKIFKSIEKRDFKRVGRFWCTGRSRWSSSEPSCW